MDAVDLLAALYRAEGQGAVWSSSSADLNVNLVRWDEGKGVDEHVNDALDVLIVCIQGQGVARIDGQEHRLSPLQVVVIPKGARRELRSAGGPFAYLTCHRQRPGLMPA